MKTYPLNLTQEELVLVTGCLVICAGKFSGRPRDVALELSVKRMTGSLSSLSDKLDEGWAVLCPETPRPGLG